MATQVQFRRGTTSQNNAFTGAQGELTIDTDVWTIRIHDGSTAGGKVVPTLTGTQTLTNKTLGSSSVWNGNAIGLGYGGTGAALSGVAGAIVYSQGSAFGLSLAGTSGQVLTSGGTSGPTWVNASALSTGTATTATKATNIAGGSAGQFPYQSDTDTTAFIAPGSAYTLFMSNGASTAPTWTAALQGLSSVAISGNTASTSTTSGALTVVGGVGIGGSVYIGGASLVHSSTGATKIAVGTTAQRPTAATGQIRYNSDLSTFEGYGGSAWGSLGGVKSVDGYTYILAETSAGASNGDIDFYAENSGGNGATQVGQWNRTNLKDYTGTLVGTQTTQNVFNATATTVNAFGASTSTTIGASTGTHTINNATVSLPNATAITTGQATVALLNTTATTINAFGAATAINIGSSSSATLTLNPGTLVGANTTQNIFNTVATTVNAFGAATTATLGYNSTAASTTNLSTGATGTGNTKTVNIGTGGAAGSTTNVNIGSSVAGTTTINSGTVVGAATTQALFNTTATTLNIGGAATTLALGASTGTASIANPTVTLTNATALNINGASPAIATSSTTASVFNSTVTTLNIGGAATTVAIGASTGTTTVNNNVTITGNLTVNGSTTTSSSQNTGYGDSLVDLHFTNNGVNTSDDGKDIGLIFNYYKTTDKNAYLIWSNATQALEYYSTATDNGTVITGTLGNYRAAGFQFAGSTSGNITVEATATAGTNTLTLPAATDTLVGRATTDTLTNKTLTSASLTSPAIGSAGYTVAGSSSGTTTVVATASASGTITLPAATDTLVGKATTDTLTNKTIAAGSNTISGLTNSNLSGTAGITNANLANSTISGISLGSNLAALTISTGLTGTSYNGSTGVTIALATSGVSAATYGSSTQIPVFTVDTYGRVTSVTNTTLQGGQYFGSAATKAIAYNSNSIAENITITTGNNGLTAGPVTISDGYTVTVSDGCTWTIV
jgi:hypothetical protein